jgi:hypothetical protein
VQGLHDALHLKINILATQPRPFRLSAIRLSMRRIKKPIA